MGVGAGIAASYGIDQGVDYVERRIHANVQRAIATTAGPLQQGQSARWQVEEKLPLTEKSGTLEIGRSFGGTIPCKDVVFKVDDDEHQVFVATICLNDRGTWVWATAEPSIHRWGGLQE